MRIVRFVKRAQELGFTLDEAEQLLRLRRVNPSRRASVRALATARPSARFWKPCRGTAMSDFTSPSRLGTRPAVVAALAASFALGAGPSWFSYNW